MRWIALLLLFAGDYAVQVHQWREQRERSLQAEDGWLSVAGLTWLRAGENRLPEAPGAVFTLRDGKVFATLAGNTRELRPDTSDALQIGRRKFFAIRRGDRTGIRLRDPDSPFRREFGGLHWYPVRPDYRIQGTFVAGPREIPVTNILGQTEPTHSPGYVEFQLAGRTLRLRPTGGGNMLFFVFRDATSGRETYGAGRFLDAELEPGGRVTLDFNKAYNPPCAFTPYATCPLPTKENRLDVRIEAGELTYGNH